MDLGLDDRDDSPDPPRPAPASRAAMDLGLDDRDDIQGVIKTVTSIMPQWISVWTTETTSTRKSRPVSD